MFLFKNCTLMMLKLAFDVWEKAYLVTKDFRDKMARHIKPYDSSGSTRLYLSAVALNL